jgi:hypothetical protein
MFNGHLSFMDAPSALLSKKQVREAPPPMTNDN